MFDRFFKKRAKTQLGIDLGNFAIKIVELSKKDERWQLQNYALAQTKDELSGFKISELREVDVAAILKSLIAEAKIESKKANISLPVGRTFSTMMEMPAMAEAELAAAIPFEAQKYVPVPLDEVILDYSIVPVEKPAVKEQSASKATEVSAQKKGASTVNILVVAVPKEIIARLTRIAKLAGLEITSLEQESFSLVRAMIGNDKNTFLIADVGRKSTDLVVVDQGIVKTSHNIDSVNKEVILMELDHIVNVYQGRYNRRVSQCLLTGGRTSVSGVTRFLESKLKIPVKTGDPFARVSREPILEPAIKELGSQLSVAIGLAMREN